MLIDLMTGGRRGGVQKIRNILFTFLNPKKYLRPQLLFTPPPLLWLFKQCGTVHMCPRGGGALHQIFNGGVQHTMKKWTQQDLRFCKNEGSKRSNNSEKVVNKIENQGEHWYKLLPKCQMTDFCEKVNQFSVKLSLELNVIETNRFFLQKERVNKIKLGIIRDPMGLENVKNGSQ